MDKLILNEQQITELVGANAYPIPEQRFLSRCIDGRYENEGNLPALAIPGADAGQLAVILALKSEKFGGFEIDNEKAYESLVEVVGGEQNLRVHTDEHSQKQDEVLMGGCGHKNRMKNDPEGFYVLPEDVAFIREKIKRAKKQGAQEVVLKGDHQEGAILFVRGEKGVMPNYDFETPSGKKHGQVFISHQTLVNERHLVLAKTLLKNGAVLGFDESHLEILYTALSEASEFHLLEIAKRLANKPPLPIYEAKFEGNDFKITSLGNVQ